MDIHAESVYVAGWFYNQKNVREMQEELRKRGFIITHDWTQHDCDSSETESEIKEKFAVWDINGVRKADFVVALWPAKTGTKMEIGCALGQRIPVFLIGSEDNNAEPLFNHIFYWHPLITHYATKEDFFEDLDKCVTAPWGSERTNLPEAT